MVNYVRFARRELSFSRGALTVTQIFAAAIRDRTGKTVFYEFCNDAINRRMSARQTVEVNKREMRLKSMNFFWCFFGEIII